ncbi:MAG: hypothetical protein ACLU4N_13445 [Butyricimonas faecihominis]
MHDDGARLKRLGANVQERIATIWGGFATLVSMLYQLPVYDSQCGAKLLKSELIPVDLARISFRLALRRGTNLTNPGKSR